MPKKSKWIWKIYLLFLIYGSIKKVTYLLYPSSPLAFYYLILTNLENYFLMDYICNVIQVFLNLFTCVPVFLFIYQYRPTKIYPWRVLFILKIIFDVLGNSYQLQTFKSMYHYDPLVCASYVIASVSLYLPGTLIWFLYAFWTNSVIGKDARPTPKFL